MSEVVDDQPAPPVVLWLPLLDGTLLVRGAWLFAAPGLVSGGRGSARRVSSSGGCTRGILRYVFDILAATPLPDAAQIPNRSLFRQPEVCEIAQVQPYVLRSWEAEFSDLGL